MKPSLILVLLAAAAAPLGAQSSGGNSPLGEPVALPTGLSITPVAAPHAVFQPLNPGLPTLPSYTVDHPVTTALSPDGTQLLVMTSGYNNALDTAGNAQNNEYVFVYGVTSFPPVLQAVFPVANTFCGLAWNPNGQEFYVSGGVNDEVYVFAKSGTASLGSPVPVYSQSATIALGHKLGLGLLSNAPAPYSVEAPAPLAGGIAVNQAGTTAVVANFFNDSISVLDLQGRSKTAELDLRPGATNPAQTGVPGGEYPYWVAIAGSTAYVSSVRDREIVVVSLNGTPAVQARIPIEGQPNRMVLNQAQSLLLVAVDNSDTVAVIDTASNQVVSTFGVVAPPGLLPATALAKGANPNSLALSPDETTLYVTNGGTNSVAVVSLGSAGNGKVAGLIPTGWYPNSVTVSQDGKYLYVINAKSVPGPSLGQCRGDTQAPGIPDCQPIPSANTYVLQLEKGGLLAFPVPGSVELASLTGQVAANNRFQAINRGSAESSAAMEALRQHIQHVIYIIKENRTYDQVLGDLPVGNGDPALTEFPQPLTPNLHSLATNFVTLDNFYDSGEVSGVGWNWSTAARTTDYVEKTVPLNYASGRGTTYDYEGLNRNVNVGIASIADRVMEDPLLAIFNPADPNLLPGAVDVAAPDGNAGEAGAGYIWDEALRAGLTVRNYGFYIDLARYEGSAAINPAYIPISTNPSAAGIVQAYTTKNSLINYTDPYFRGFDQSNADFYNFQEWSREFQQYVANGNLPSLSLVRFPHDHFGNFSTALYGLGTPGTQVADNDYAVGLLVEAVAASPYASNTLIFVVEDDAQDGADHVDAHRSIAFVAGPYVKQQAVVSTRYTTVSMVRTIEDILGLTPSSLNSAAAAPMSQVFDPSQTTWTYSSIVPQILRSSSLPLPPATAQNSLPLTRRVAAYAKDRHPAAWWQKRLGDQDFDEEDKLDTPKFNLILWKGMMGNKPYPTVRDGRDLRENRAALLAGYGIE
jgi:YVTN family beta-propeller protein